MAQQVHYAKASMQSLDLSKAGSAITIDVHYKDPDYDDEDNPSKEKIGTLKIGHGGLTWKKGRKHKAQRLSWPAFAALMDKR